MGKYYDTIWQAYDYSEEKRMKVRQEVADEFDNADLMIIAEYEDEYSTTFPYSFYKFREEFSRYLNAPGSPRFVVRGLLRENMGYRLLVLQRETNAAGQGEPLKLPYGMSTNPHEDYGPKVIRF